MKPIFKYSGGKSREAKLITSLAPFAFDRVIEPFAGSGAIAFHLEKPCILGDTRLNNVATLRAVRDNFEEVNSYIEHIRTLNIEDREKEYYIQRDDNFEVEDDISIAKRWILLRQQCFSGMDRIGKKGKFNVPFGWYKSFTCNLNINHSKFLKNSELLLQGYEDTFDLVKKDDFVFLDPPYYKRNSEYGGDYDDNAIFHAEIADKFRKTIGKAMMVHIDCPLYRDLYKDYNIIDKPYTYSQNFKGREAKDNKVKHLYITNYVD